MSSTDTHWELYGRTNPYFGVITDPKFDASRIDDSSRRAFFQSGESYVTELSAMLERSFGPIKGMDTGVDFGCGVGRVLIPLARLIPGMTGVDVSPSMLQETKENLASAGLSGTRLVQRLENLPEGTTFDLVHSVMVLQHIPEKRGQRIVEQLVEMLKPGGIGALHLLYFNPYKAQTFSALVHKAYSAVNIKVRQWLAGTSERGAEALGRKNPPMQMNPYDVNRVFLCLQRQGIREIHGEFTDHGGFLGAVVSFRK
jgi:2-polyprenyl-3-methyl-5-hydroxy-6-metoxy-1,4-benzoquinol methylase